MKTLLFFISDIHLTGKKPENEGAVISAFCVDVKKQLATYPHDKALVLVGGDLVYAADSEQSYELFWDNVIQKLIDSGIDEKNVICVPGNHDIQRQWIKDNQFTYAPFLSQQFSESKFNDFANGDKASWLTDKFGNYKNFAKKHLGENKAGLDSFSVEINDEWSLYCINSSLTSFGGVESNDYLLLKDDNRKLNVNTRKLYEWLQVNGKKKILMMHHPMDFLTDWASAELQKIIRNDFDLVLTGHTHLQEILCNQNGNDSFVWCKAPQLYTDKHEKLGYSILVLNDSSVDSVIYREWFEHRNSFRPGLDFTEEEDGIVHININKEYVLDPILSKIENKYKDSMSIYGDNSLIWIDRYFSTNRFDRSLSIGKANLLSEQDILNSKRNLKILTPAQYGLTSFAWHFLLKLWKEKREFGLYIDCSLIRHGKIERLIENALSDFKMNKDKVRWIILDDWMVSNKDAKQILSNISSTFENIPVMILCPMLEKPFIEMENISYDEYNFINMYMAPMHKGQLRSMVDVYNRNRNIGDEEIVLKRLSDDIENFNLHRTPLNCISLLEVFSSSFDENPVNRTAMIDKLLRIIFDNECVPKYRSLPDVQDCEFVLGYFCEGVIRKDSYFFSNKEFLDCVSDFCKHQKITLDVNYLFDILLRNQIICQYDCDLYGFRFAFWVYYFAAMRMMKSSEFASFILNDENYARYPDILEFYTGSDRSRDNAADIVINDINKIIDCVNEKVGFEDKLNPFKRIKVNLSDEQVSRAINQLDENLKKSKLPNSIKDAIDDNMYNPSRPYHQDIKKVWDNYSVSYLQEIIQIASKTLRNSDYINPKLKEDLLKSITTAWYNMIKVVYLMVPTLVKNGVAGYDGFGLLLSDDFNEYNDPNRKMISIITCIPENIISWFKDDIYSSKLADLFYEKISSETNPVIKHILIHLIISEMPDGWEPYVKKYLDCQTADSYYYYDVVNALRLRYARGIMTESDIYRTKNLILLAYTKMRSKDNKMKPGEINNLQRNFKVLPERAVDKDEQ